MPLCVAFILACKAAQGLCSLCLQFARQELDRAAAVAAAAAAAGVQDAPSPALLQAANTAEHLAYWALQKAARKLGRLQGQQAGGGASAALPPTVADVLALPVEARCHAAEAGVPQVAAGSEDAALGAHEDQEDGQQRHLARRDVVGDLGVIVVTLRRQDCR